MENFWGERNQGVDVGEKLTKRGCATKFCRMVKPINRRKGNGVQGRRWVRIFGGCVLAWGALGLSGCESFRPFGAGGTNMSPTLGGAISMPLGKK